LKFSRKQNVNQSLYENHHVYPYTYKAGYKYRQGDYKGALKAWSEAASVVKKYKYSKDDEEIYKELMEINNELIPHILKTNESLVNDPECFYDLLQFYDGICSWEEDSATPVLHIGWVKPIVKCFLSFEYDIRSKVEIRVVLKEEETKDEPSKPSQKFTLTLHSVKMAALKDILQAEKMNSSALHLQLTAQTETKKNRSSLDLEGGGRSKRIRRE